MTDRNDGRPRHSASHIHCAVPFFCARSGTEGEAAWRCGEWIVGSAGNASHSLRACVGAAWGSGSAREGRVAVLGREQIFGGECVVRSAGLTHFRRSRSRVRVLLYIRPPCPRREIAVMGMKDAPCEHPSPTKTFAPAPSAFALPRRRSHFLRIPFGGAHEDFGLPQQQLSTMGYPRKSYPHRCSSPCAKRSRPRACARVYIIYRSPVGRSRECPRRCGEEVAPLWPRGPRRRAQGGGGRGQRRTPPRAVPRTFPAYRRAPARLCAESLCAKAEVHKVNPAPARAFSPRQLVYRRAPAPCRLPPRPRRLNGHPASAGGRENHRMAHRRTATPTHRTQRGNDTCTIRVP